MSIPVYHTCVVITKKRTFDAIAEIVDLSTFNNQQIQSITGILSDEKKSFQSAICVRQRARQMALDDYVQRFNFIPDYFDPILQVSPFSIALSE